VLVDVVGALDGGHPVVVELVGTLPLIASGTQADYLAALTDSPPALQHTILSVDVGYQTLLHLPHLPHTGIGVGVVECLHLSMPRFLIPISVLGCPGRGRRAGDGALSDPYPGRASISSRLVREDSMPTGMLAGRVMFRNTISTWTAANRLRNARAVYMISRGRDRSTHPF
jgi:hypothetical protein